MTDQYIRIERAQNGFIVHQPVGYASAQAVRPLVFDSFERLIDWMRGHYGVHSPDEVTVNWIGGFSGAR